MNNLLEVADFFYEIVLYLIWMGVPHLVVAFLIFLGLRKRTLGKSGPFLLRYLFLFPVVLLLAGALADAVWHSFVYEVKYHSVDYFADFDPFFRIREGSLTFTWSGPRGGPINGATFEEIYHLWDVFAASTWAGAIVAWVLVSFYLGHRFRTQP